MSNVTKFQDWFLPSQDELLAIYDNLIANGLGNLPSGWYWSSTEVDAVDAIMLDADIEDESGLPSEDRMVNLGKDISCYVRPIRAFVSSTPYVIGATGPAGGTIFHISTYNAVIFYYECAPENVSDGSIWSNVLTEIGATAQGELIGTGVDNTNEIILQTGFSTGAAKLCKDLVVEVSAIPVTNIFRVTPEEVKAIIDTTLTDTIVYSYILGANALVNTALGTGATAILKEIERWLTAHLIASTKERQAKKEEAGGAKIEYTGNYGAGLHSTSYGQMCMTMDTTGALASLMGKAVKIFAIPSFD